MTLICTWDRDRRSKKTMRKHHTHKNLNEMSEALIQLDVKGITARINNGWVCMGRQGFEKKMEANRLRQIPWWWQLSRKRSRYVSEVRREHSDHKQSKASPGLRTFFPGLGADWASGFFLSPVSSWTRHTFELRQRVKGTVAFLQLSTESR